METDFTQATEKRELSGFDLAKALYQKVRYSNPALAFGVTRELIVPELKDFGTDKALATVLDALAPETENIDLEDPIRLPFSQEASKRSLRELVFPEPKRYEETGPESNRQLARILNSLSDIGRTDPIEALRRGTDGHVLQLPAHPDSERREKRERDRLQRGQDFKKTTLDLVAPELQALLYDGTQAIGSRMQYALYQMPSHLIGGDQVEKALRKVINDFGDVGALLRDGHDLKSAVGIMKRARDMRAGNTLKKEIT